MYSSQKGDVLIRSWQLKGQLPFGCDDYKEINNLCQRTTLGIHKVTRQCKEILEVAVDHQQLASIETCG